MPGPAQTQQVLGLAPGELVRVRPASEIFATLDERGTLEGLPFMPEMVKYCGRIVPVSQRADKTCAGLGEVRRMHNTVFLRNLRCDGSAHDGCQAACLMHWKEAWLERVTANANGNGNGSVTPREPDAGEAAFVAGTLIPATTAADSTEEARRYSCQATEIPNASTPMRFREIDQYVSDVSNWSLRKVLRGLLVDLFNQWQAFSRRRLPHALLIADGRAYPFIRGSLEKGRTPSATLDLRPGDVVRVKSKEEIVATLDHTNRTRGLTFDGEMVKYCGRTARVRARVDHLIEEQTGEMIDIKSDCIILEGVICKSDYHRFCPRGIYPYWREIWLERVT